MKTRATIAFAMIAGFGLGAVAIEGLHAQAKPPVYVVTEIDISNPDAYIKEYAPLAQASVRNHGGKLLAASSKPTSIEGQPPKRIAVSLWEDMGKVEGWRKSDEYQKARITGNKYAKFRTFAVEGLPQK